MLPPVTLLENNILICCCCFLLIFNFIFDLKMEGKLLVFRKHLDI